MARLVFIAILLSACADKPAPTSVEPGDTSPDSAAPADTATPTDSVTPADTSTPDTRPGVDDPSGLWVEDQNGVPVGLLVRRGSDDAVAARAIYDLVTVFHPPSGLFFEVSMTDAVVRYPANTFFEGFSCGTPMGIGVGSCTECRSAWGLGLLHGGKWWKVRGGATFETAGPGSVIKGGMSTECVAHGTSNAKLFPIDAVTGVTPPTTFAAPLRFVAR